MQSVMISINPPYAAMIMNEYKFTEFRKKVINAVIPGTIVYIYETKNKGGSGNVIGRCVVDKVLYLQTNVEKELNVIEKEFTHQFNTVADRYKIANNQKKFDDYLNAIGFGGNYGIVLKNIEPFHATLEDFTCNEKRMVRPPQNMCSCQLL